MDCVALQDPWSLLSKNAGAGWHFLLQRNFLTQGSNLCIYPALRGKFFFTIWATWDMKNTATTKKTFLILQCSTLKSIVLQYNSWRTGAGIKWTSKKSYWPEETEVVGDGRAEGSSAIGDRGAAVSLTPEVVCIFESLQLKGLRVGDLPCLSFIVAEPFHWVLARERNHF